MLNVFKPRSLKAAIAGCLFAGVLVACNSDKVGTEIVEEATPVGFALAKIGTYEGGALGAAEITAYDSGTQRLFVVNGTNGTVDVLNLSNPALPTKIGTITPSATGGAVNSVAVFDGLVALAIEANPKTSPGAVGLYAASDLRLLQTITVGAQPDMITFTPDGRYILTANEGEPNSYNLPTSIDPEGSVSVITVVRGGTSTVATADFRAFNGQEAALRAQGIRIFGPNASAAQDLEPEYVAVSDDSRTAYVTLQENNAIAVVDIATARVTSLKPLGLKDHNAAGFGLDASDEDGGVNTNSGTPSIKIQPYPVRGMYQPDGIAYVTINNTGYLLTANEGEARADWPGYSDETRVREHCTAGLDPNVFPDAANLILDSNLGRLRITRNPNGGREGKNAAGQCNELNTFGGRSFTIWNTDIARVYDSGDEFERRTTSLPNVNFNASHDNNTLDGRSASKGPEPEGVVVAKFGKKTIAFIGLERVGGVMVYDISNPAAATYVTYLNTRNGVTGDRGPEGLHFIPAAKSPNGRPLLIVGNEISGTTAIFQVNLTY
jgi:DNA-binding beta-propeller fold protein YncE